MRDIIPSVLDNLSGIGISVIKSIKEDLLSPPQTHSLEEQLYFKNRRQNSLIQSQQDRINYQAGVVEDQSRGIRDRDDLLVQKDKEIRNLKETIRSLEFQLQEATSRSKHWR